MCGLRLQFFRQSLCECREAVKLVPVTRNQAALAILQERQSTEAVMLQFKESIRMRKGRLMARERHRPQVVREHQDLMQL